MNNTVIKVLNKKHGKEVIKYWKSLGVDTENKRGNSSIPFIYYGLINKKFENYSLNQVKEANAKIIELPTTCTILEITNSVEMMVSEDNVNWTKRLIVFKFNNLYHAINKFEDNLTAWKYCKPIEELQIVQLTMQDISDGKGERPWGSGCLQAA